MDRTELYRIRRDHSEIVRGTRTGRCQKCSAAWPCDTAKVLMVLDALEDILCPTARTDELRPRDTVGQS